MLRSERRLTPRPRRPVRRGLRATATAGVVAAGLAACGGSSHAFSTAAGPPGAIPTAADPSAAAGGATPALADWPTFGLDAQRTAATDASPGIDAGNVRRLRRRVVRVAGTVDSAPILLHGVRVAGATHDLILATTSYGRTVALDASSGQTLWTFTPPGYAGWAGSAQITNATPVADPGRAFVYAASPDGRVHKLSIADGREAPGWPVSVTRDPGREKIGGALNLDGGDLVAATGGYDGDTPPYQGHLVLIDRASGRRIAVFNTLCSNRHTLLVPSSCPGSDSAIWAREGAVVEPDGRLLVATGNGPYDGRANFGDSVLEFDFPGLRLRQAYTPSNQGELNSSDTDLGSSAPALLGAGRIAQTGKDGILRVLDLARLDGRPPLTAPRVGGTLQTLGTPGDSGLYSSPAVWHHAGRTVMFLADFTGTEAYTLDGGRLTARWRNDIPGNSPVVAGGLVYVYDPDGGGVTVYRPASPRPLTKLPTGGGHWNSAIVADGHVVVGEGNANDHSRSGVIDIFSLV